MKNEINKDFYCSSGCYDNGCKSPFRVTPAFCLGKECFSYHHKWPTPEQFREEYGEEYAEHRPVWWKFGDGDGIWRTRSYNRALELFGRQHYRNVLIVCACTPCDRPPADWRPE